MDLKIEKPSPEWKYEYGQRLRKIRGSSWQGHVVGFYSTTLTQEGYAIESERELGSVQIYPVAALEPVPD
jgi:dihydrofolate reductase (trimethoprim resistance protein)